MDEEKQVPLPVPGCSLLRDPPHPVRRDHQGMTGQGKRGLPGPAPQSVEQKGESVLRDNSVVTDRPRSLEENAEAQRSHI